MPVETVRKSLLFIKHALIFVGILLFIWLMTSAKTLWGVEELGHWFEKSNYKAQYYANLFEEDSKSKNYRVKADIERYSDYSEDIKVKTIYLHKAYFPEGGYLTFEGCEIEIDKKVSCKPEGQDEYWYIELTDQKIPK